MKTLVNKYIFPLFLGSSLMISSCSHFEEMNIDPNNIDRVVPGSLMAPLIYDIASFSSTRSYDFTWQIMQVSFPYPSTAVGVHRYDITPTAGNSTWNKSYTWLRSIKELDEASVTSNQPIYKAVAKTLEAYTVSMLTDAFGDVPYSEAIKLDENISLPKFDKQEDIYLTLLTSLEEANDIYTTAIGPMTGNDILYNNDKAKWQKFNNSLLMRLLLRLSKRTEINSYNRIKAMLDNPSKYPIFANNNDAAILKINGISPFEYAWNRRQDYTLNQTKAEYFVDLLNSFDDPRRAFFMTQASEGNPSVNIGYKGIPAAHEASASFNFTPSIPNADLMVPTTLGTTIHEIIMPYAEVEFIKSEVYLHFKDNTKAEEAYKKGITAGITQWIGITAPENSYFDNIKIKFNGTLEQIINQKYVALYMCDYQQWFEYRRTGFPVLPTTPHMLHDGVMPKRFMYHDKLSITNPENYKLASQTMEFGDSPLSRVWWEK